jgi:eukaryotic-like serine/threonine-protein kinase
MKKLGKFEIIQKVGQGAMGVVYKAHDPMIDRIVALKTLTTGLSEDPNLLKRFYSEARSAGSLRHPNIVTIYELGHEGDIPFIAMQFLKGESLDKIIDRLPNLPLSQKVGFIVHVCRALEYAHKQNPPVIHRDIKPGNVMVCPDGSVVVVDFGIARLGENTMSQSAGMLIGTLGYMSPQLFRGATADPRSDIWATGVMFYEVLAYRRPFKGETPAALMSSIVLEEPRSILEAAPGTPTEIGTILDRMLAKDVEARYQNMEEVLRDLEPVWMELLHSDISILFENSQRLFREGDLLAAKSEIVQILNWEPSNLQAKILGDRINAELRRQQVFPQVKARVESAQKLLAEGRNEEAKSEAEAALKLDSSFQPAQEVVRQANAALEREREIRRAIHASKQRMAEGALTEAETQLDKVLALDPSNAAVRDQIRQVRDERQRREQRKQRDTLLNRARTFLTNLQYDDCINLLLAAEKEFPGDPEILKLLETARNDQTEQKRQALLAEVRDHIDAQRFDAALKALDVLMEQFPSEASEKSLRTRALQARDQQKREQRLSEGKSELRALLKEKKFQESIARGEELLREIQADLELTELLEFARTEQSQIERKHRLDQSTEQIQQAIKNGRLPEAIQIAERALLEFPQNTELLTLLDGTRREQAEKEKQELLKQRLREMERMLERQELTEAIDLARQTITTIGPDPRLADTIQRAEREREFREQKKRRQDETLQMARTMLDRNNIADTTLLLNEALETKLFPVNDPRIRSLLEEIDVKKVPPTQSPNVPSTQQRATAAAFPGVLSSPSTGDPAKDYVYMRGAPMPEAPGHAEQTAGTAEGSASSQLPSGSRPIPVQSAPFSFESRTPAPSSLTSASSEIDLGRKEKPHHALGPLEKYFATFVGPMASIIVQRAASNAKDREELFALLAAKLPSEKDREVFFTRKEELLGGAETQSRKETSTPGSAVQPSSVARSAELTPATVRHASELLARYIGPVARLLTEREVHHADSLRTLYLSLAEHLRNRAERAQFLREAGFPES